MSRYFVYELVDTRDGYIFYIGKGCGNRPADHTREAKAGKNTAKCRLIREIIAAGHEVAVVIIKRFAKEAKAFAYEKKQIALHGLDSLTNIAPGGPWDERWVKKADPDLVALREDRKLAVALLGLARKSNGFKEMLSIRLGGQSWPIPSGFHDSMRSLLKALVDRRGIDWCVKTYNAALPQSRLVSGG
jgi:hypothetical protein